MITEQRSTVPTPNALRPESRLKALLPWIIAGGALLAYLVTLNRWVSFSSLERVARISGWTWQPEIWPWAQPQPAPLYWLLTYPLRALPTASIPIALNLFSAVLAALTLALLGRSVTLLPHDRTQAERLREKSDQSLLSLRSAWIPPLLAVVACGLQLTFWENATAASQDILNLFLFAYVIRSFLEFRIDGRQSWLSRAAFVYGLGIANDWAFLGFFPILIAAVIWAKGLGFFDMRFLGRMCLWGFLGLLLYLLLPLVQSLSDQSPVPFWAALRANLGGQKALLAAIFNKQMLIHADKPLWVLGIASLLPLLVMSIRWPSYSGDTSHLGTSIASFSFHLVNAILLSLCLWIAMDPPMSPRFHVAEGLRPWLPMLTLYYLGALGIGYFSGYFLLIFGKKIDRLRKYSAAAHNSSELRVHLGGTLILLIIAMLMIGRNLPQIRATNGPALKSFAQLLVHGLPKEPAIVLSDDPRKLLLAQAITSQPGHASEYVFLDTASLKWPDYLRFLSNRYPKLWPTNELAQLRQLLDDGGVMHVVWNLSESNTLYYLHPSFGYFFERFYSEPHGLVYALRQYPTNSLVPPSLDPAISAENEAFWQEAAGHDLAGIQRFLPSGHVKRSKAGLDKVFALAHLSTEPNRDISLLAGFCSRAMNYWGVEAQRERNLPSAAAHFERALEWNADNVVASINLDCNKSLQAGRQPGANLSKAIEDKFGKYRKWDQVLNANGPFDQPDFCYEQGQVFVRSGLYRQAAQEFERAVTLAPEHVAARLMLGQLSLAARIPTRTVELVNEIHAMPPAISLARSNQTDLLSLEMSAHLVQNDLPAAESALKNALARFPGDEELVSVATTVYMRAERFTNALAVLNQQLRLNSNNIGALNLKGLALMQTHDYEAALVQLNRVLSLESTNSQALFNRALSYLHLNRLDESQTSYEELYKQYPTYYQILYGLQEIAWRRKDTNGAIRYCEQYLTNAPPNNVEEINLIRQRLAGLKPSAP